MDKYINATRLSNTIDKALQNLAEEDNTVSKMYCKMAMEYAKRLLEEEIAAGGEYKPVVHAHWIEHWADFGESLYCECSSCHDSTGVDFTPFCGVCGAIMDEPKTKIIEVEK